MKISTQIFLGYFVVVAIAASFMLSSFLEEIKPGIRQATEHALVDTANLLAETVEQELLAGDLETGSFQQAVSDYLERKLNAKIWGLNKSAPDLRIYVTDDKGMVIYDSTGVAIGADYSKWRDVYLTLRGEYGARTTSEDRSNRINSVMHVAAPISHKGRLIGVLTVAKPNVSVEPFIELTRRNVRYRSIWLVVGALLLGMLLSYWLSRSIRKLEDYAIRVRKGGRVKLPKLHEKELSTLASAMESMRNELEGKEYVERYVHALTHEMKSPLSAIRGASELLSEGLPLDEQQKFLDNISRETSRLHQFIERMLDLAAVEKQQALQNIELIDLGNLVLDLCKEKETAINIKFISLHVDIQSNVVFQGERFLIRQAISNLLDNAIDFAHKSSEIGVKVWMEENNVLLEISDNGPGIPEYAINRVFERFYSLPKIDNGKKSSGLGLSFVKEVMELHAGDITLTNRPTGGAIASLKIPRK